MVCSANSNSEVYHSRNQGGVDRAVLSFDLKAGEFLHNFQSLYCGNRNMECADLTSIWHWNTHQVNVFLVAEYTTDEVSEQNQQLLTFVT